MTGDYRTIVLALIGGLLGWSLGKLLDTYGKGMAPYVVILALAVLILLMMT
jgi:hypothetical protein